MRDVRDPQEIGKVLLDRRRGISVLTVADALVHMAIPAFRDNHVPVNYSSNGQVKING